VIRQRDEARRSAHQLREQVDNQCRLVVELHRAVDSQTKDLQRHASMLQSARNTIGDLRAERDEARAAEILARDLLARQLANRNATPG
jgi:adenylosuccinate synthase